MTQVAARTLGEQRVEGVRVATPSGVGVGSHRRHRVRHARAGAGRERPEPDDPGERRGAADRLHAPHATICDTWRSVHEFANVSRAMSETASESSTETARTERARSAGNTRTLLMVVGPLTAAGIALAAVGDAAIGRWLVILGVLGLILGLHRYGRLGADPPPDLRD
jgi:hypothetical protein